MQHIDYTAHECSEESDQKEEKQTVLFPLFKVSLSVYFAQHHIRSYCCRFVGGVLGIFKEFSSASRGESCQITKPTSGLQRKLCCLQV